jgi:hypothetical protein
MCKLNNVYFLLKALEIIGNSLQKRNITRFIFRFYFGTVEKISNASLYRKEAK